jgi:hypothetical protein
MIKSSDARSEVMNEGPRWMNKRRVEEEKNKSRGREDLCLTAHRRDYAFLARSELDTCPGTAEDSDVEEGAATSPTLESTHAQP